MSKYALGRLLGLTKCRLVWSCLGHCRNEKARCGAGLRVSESLWWMLLALSLFPYTEPSERAAGRMNASSSIGNGRAWTQIWTHTPEADSFCVPVVLGTSVKSALTARQAM